MKTFESLLAALQEYDISEDEAPENVRQKLRLFLHKLSESSRNNVKRCKERYLDEALQLQRQISEAQLRCLEDDHLLLLVKLLLSMQLQMASISTACRKVDKMLQYMAKVDHQLVFRETLHCLDSTAHSDQVLTHQDLQRACMFLEDSAVGREVWKKSYKPMLNKVSELFTVVLQQESLRDGPLCYTAVKVCLQIFQLLATDVAPLVWEQDGRGPAAQSILQSLMDILLGQCCNRDTRLLAGVAVAMMVNTASDSRAGGAAAWSLLQVSLSEPWLLSVGALQVQCTMPGKDGVDRLSISRGLLTCSSCSILLSSQDNVYEKCLLLNGLFPVVSSLCEERKDCHYFAFEALTLWMKRVKESLPDIWKKTGVRLLPDSSSLQQQLIHIIWTNAESPVEGVVEFVRTAFCLLLDLYEMECKQFSDTNKALYYNLLLRIVELPWEAKAKTYHLCALLPYLGTDIVCIQYSELPDHLLKCLSTNHLSPRAAELYRCLIQQQRKELCRASQQSVTEPDLAGHWARRWQPVIHKALTSQVVLQQSNCSTQLLPITFQVFPSAVDYLLVALDPQAPGHLHAWANIMSSYRAVTGCPLWASQESSAFETLQLALGSADDKIRVAALNLLCCCPKTKETPTTVEMAIMKTFILQNLNCESSSFRQHFQAGLKRFLVRIRDGCLSLVRGQKGQKGKHQMDATNLEELEDTLEQGIGFVHWLSQLPFSFLSKGHNYQRKKTALLLLSAVLETCTDTWSPDRKKGQPPANIGSLIQCARDKEKWDFFSNTNLLVLLSCLEDSTNEIRDLSAELLLRFFPPRFPDDVVQMLLVKSSQLLCSPRVQEAQMGALMRTVLFLKSLHQENNFTSVKSGSEPKTSCMISALVKELEKHYLTAREDMMLAARTTPIHGVLSALQKCLFQSPTDYCAALDDSLIATLLDLLEKISLLLLGVLYGDSNASATDKDAPPSFCDMGNAISSLIAQSGGGQVDGDECVLLSEEHSLVLTCCWVSLKEIGVLLGSLVEKILSESNQYSQCQLKRDDIKKVSKIFKDILLKCRHWGAVEGCCVGFTKFCVSLLGSSDPEVRGIPAQMLKQGLQVVQCLRSTSITRRAAGLPMLILSVLSAEEASKSRPLLAHSMQALLETAKTPLTEKWDQTLDLPQVCAVHTLQALVRGSSLGVAVLQFAPSVAILSLTLLSSPCWAMRNAALQLYSTLCSRMLGQRSSSDEAGPTQHAMSPSSFFFHFPALQPFLLGELRAAAGDLQCPSSEAKLHLKPSLYPILTLLAQLQPGIQDSTKTLSDFLPPLLELSASPVYGVRVMASKALVAMSAPSEYMSILIRLLAALPSSQKHCCHNRLHGQLLQIKAMLQRALSLGSFPSSDLSEVLRGVQASMWLVTEAQRCPLVRAVYLNVADSLRELPCQSFLSELSDILMQDLQKPQQGLQIGLSFYHQQAIHFLNADSKCATTMWNNFSAMSPDLRLSLVSWVVDGRSSQQASLTGVIQKVLQSNLRETLLSRNVDYRRIYLQALGAVMTGAEPTSPHSALLQEPDLPECLDLLLGDLADQRGGPEFLSQALRASSLLLSQAPDSSLKISKYQRWCSILESQRVPEAPEVLRVASAEALCVAGVPLINNSLQEQTSPPAIVIRVINTGLHLLQDQNQQVRMKAACFVSLLHHARRSGSQKSVHLMQVNLALPLLLDLLMEKCWDTPGTLDVLLCHVPQVKLSVVLKEASAWGSSSLYEQDEANVFAEPSVMAAHVLPYLLQMAGRYTQSSALAQSLNSWAERNAAQLLDDLAVCRNLQQADSFSPSWLALLTDPHFHSALCGLLTRATLLLELQKSSDEARHLGDPSSIHIHLREVCGLLRGKGVHLPPTLEAAACGEPPS